MAFFAKGPRDGILRTVLLMITISGVISTDISACITTGIKGLALFIHIFHLILSAILIFKLVLGLDLMTKLMSLQLTMVVLDICSFVLFLVAGILLLSVSRKSCGSVDDARIAAGVLSLMAAIVEILCTVFGIFDFRNMLLEPQPAT